MHSLGILKRNTGHIISTLLRSGDTLHLTVTLAPYHSVAMGRKHNRGSAGPPQIHLSHPLPVVV